MPRRNLCENPALGVDLTGWVGGEAPTRQAVTGFLRPWAARYLAPTASFVRTPRIAITEGLTYTLSVYLRIASIFATASVGSYIGWYSNVSGSGSEFVFASIGPFANNDVTRLVRTGTAPAGKTHVDLTFDSWGTNQTHLDFTAMLVEEASAEDGYADGDSPGWVWDGTAGLSASRETGGTTRGSASPSIRSGVSTVAPSRLATSVTSSQRGATTMQTGPQ